jgi:hypothetical protein
MATVLNLNARTPGGGSGEARPVLPTDVYRMKIMDAKIEDDKWAKPNKDGVLPIKLALTFEITTLTEEQQEAAAEEDQDWDTVRIWHRFNPFYGDVKAGGPSKFKAFIDDLVKWGLLNIPDMNTFDVETLVGIELKCSVAEYTKTMGDNAGQPGNKITAFAPIRKASKGKNVPQPVTVDAPAGDGENDDLPL